MFTGTHDGGAGASVLRDVGALFKSLGVDPSLEQYVENVTQSTNGTATASTDDTVTVSGVTWNNGDTYNIYKTSTKDGYISAISTDVSRGWKVTEPDELDKDGWLVEDTDIDDHGRKDIFGSNQPEPVRRI